MAFSYPYFKPQTPEEKYAGEVLSILEYSKINSYCKDLGYLGVGDFLIQLNIEFDYSHNLNPKEMLKNSYPFRLKDFKDIKKASPPIIGPLIRSSKVSYFEESLFDSLIEKWIIHQFQSTDRSINDQRNRLKVFEAFNNFLNKEECKYNVNIVELAKYELEKRLHRNSDSFKIAEPIRYNLSRSEIAAIAIVSEEIVECGLIENSTDFLMVFSEYSDIQKNNLEIVWKQKLSDLSLLLVLIEHHIIQSEHEPAKLVLIIESDFRDENNSPFTPKSIGEAISRSRNKVVTKKIEKEKKSLAPILLRIVLTANSKSQNNSQSF